MTTALWFAPNCPTWCNGPHEAALCHPDDHDAPPWAAPLIVHSRTLTRAEGLSVELVHHELHPDGGPSDDPPLLVVYLPEDHDAQGTDPSELRRWADVLTRAADAADAHLKGPHDA